MKTVLIVAAFILTAGMPHAQSPHIHQHSFGDAQKWSKIFDDPQRDAWQKPHEVIQALALKPDAIVADIGAGTGYFAMRLAHMTPKGRVYAIDTEPAMVKHLAERAKREGLANVTAVTGTANDPRLPEAVDLVLLVDVYHHIAERERYFSKLASALKPRGRVAIIDFRMDSPQGRRALRGSKPPRSKPSSYAPATSPCRSTLSCRINTSSCSNR
jgi:cyclopropane fatty-acyl-phospholipid synthase-like methyltransferase